MFPLFNFSLLINGFPIQKAKAELRKIQSISEQEFEAFIENKKQEIVHYHLKNNSSYQKLVGKTTFNNWNDLPIMTKKDFQKPLIERLSTGFSLKNVYINKTSGSSGNPFVFAKDKFSHALTWANIINRFGWHGIDFNSSYQARFYGMPLDFFAKTKLRFKDFVSNRYRFVIFDLSDKGMAKIIHHFKKNKFDYINGYTSNIVLMAKYLEKNNQILTNICPTLKVCIVTSEMLFEEDKILLEKQLGVPVVNEYGASELGIIAIENPEGEWQVNAESLFIEILDEKNQPLALGNQGKIVVTSLYNKAHPFIRYEIGDIGILAPKSTPKKPILEKLIGRINDVASLPGGKKSPGMTFYSITKKLFGDEGNVKEFVIKQTKIDTFIIEYTSDKSLSDFEIEKTKKVFSIYLEPNLHYIFIRKEKLERSKSGKLKQFVSLLK